MTRASRLLLPLLLLPLFAGTAAAADSSAAAVATPATYDRDLCALAQRMLVNADTDPAPFELEVLRGTGNGFHTIQMDVDAPRKTVVIATAAPSARVDGAELQTHVECKLVDRERVNDVLGLSLAGPERSCRDVNAHTYRLALDSLTPAERSRYESGGRKLVFGADYLAATGAEWLPAPIDKFIAARDASNGAAAFVEVSAPAVVVPWSKTERKFFQGTHHCKLLTLATMQRWMRGPSMAATGTPVPSSAQACTAPHATTSTMGSCLFWFAPAKSSFCQDYSGAEWTPASARAECGKRHASAEALQASKNRYEGAGGIYSGESCAARTDRDALNGTCVFHCKQADETLWHPLVTGSAEGAGAMMTRACDLFIP